MQRITCMACLCLLGCLSPEKKDMDTEAPIPDARTVVVDDDGVTRPALRSNLVVMLSTSTPVEASRQSQTGISFDLPSAAQPLITIETDYEKAYRVLIYGPKDELGLWNELVFQVRRFGAATIDDWVVSNGGHYLLIVQPVAFESARFSVRVECPSCEMNACATESPCNLFCPSGLGINPNTGCPVCACADASCAVDGCSKDGEECVFECGETHCEIGSACQDGQCVETPCDVTCDATQSCVDGTCVTPRFECRPQDEDCERQCPVVRSPVCAIVEGRRRTFPNRCLAECILAEGIEAGECQTGCESARDCPPGESCANGQCISDSGCDCENARPEPLCGRNGDTVQSFRNRCQMECEGFEFEHFGRCIEQSRCEHAQDCSPMDRCIAVPDTQIRGNAANCAQDPSDSRCVRICVSRPRCDRSGRCEDGQCMPMSAGKVCMPTCTSSDAECQADEKCVIGLFDSNRSGVGICLNRCDDDELCGDGLSCLPTLAACAPCAACDSFGSASMCVAGEIYGNACEQLCAGVAALSLSAEAPRRISDEVCNGVDDDCDGVVDELLVERCRTDSLTCPEGARKCIDGMWGPCKTLPIEARELCNNQDDDCDGVIDEEPMLSTSSEACAPDRCAQCTQEWEPVCTLEGLMPNRCYARCSGLNVIESERCGLVSFESSCSADTDCAPTACERGSVCARRGVEMCVRYSDAAQCFEENAECGCNRETRQCSYLVQDETSMCLSELNGNPTRTNSMATPSGD